MIRDLALSGSHARFRQSPDLQKSTIPQTHIFSVRKETHDFAKNMLNHYAWEYHNMQGINFIAIDFETATAQRASICEAGICVVRDGKIAETRSWLVRPQGNSYSYWNTRIHGICPNDTIHSPEFPEVWHEISAYLENIPVLVAHNAAFDIGCIRHSLEFYGMRKPDITYFCSLRAARRLYKFSCNSLDYLCGQFMIPQGQHHRAGDDAEMCARLFLTELEDAGCGLDGMDFCNGKL